MKLAIFYMLEELEKIAELNPELEVAGEIMCPRCRHRLKFKKEVMCPKCGEQMKPVDEVEGNDDYDSPDMSADEGEDTSYVSGNDAEQLGKSAGLLSPFIGGAAVGAGGYAGVKALNYTNSPEAKRAKALEDRRRLIQYYTQLRQQKTAGVRHARGSRMACLNLKSRGGRYSSVEDGLRRLRGREKIRELGGDVGSNNVD